MLRDSPLAVILVLLSQLNIVLFIAYHMTDRNRLKEKITLTMALVFVLMLLLFGIKMIPPIPERAAYHQSVKVSQ